jgi:hypothetical protein
MHGGRATKDVALQMTIGAGKVNMKSIAMGACRNSIFSCFLPVLAKKVVPDSRFSDARFFQGRLLVIL